MHKKRCEWSNKDELYQNYHDTEWGDPVSNDERLFESLSLEAFQSGLSWHTILKKRDYFRTAFQNFNLQKVASFSDSDIKRLLNDEGIIRHKLKIQSTINNAQAILKIQDSHGSFYQFLQKFKPQNPSKSIKSWDDVHSFSPESELMCKALKKEGVKFVGKTTCYSFMQAVGMVNDHFDYCWKKKEYTEF